MMRKTVGSVVLAVVAHIPASALAGNDEPPADRVQLPTAAEIALAYEHLRPMSARFHEQEEQAQPTDGQDQEPSDGQPKTPAPLPNTGMHPAATGALIGTAVGFSAGCIAGIAHGEDVLVVCPTAGAVYALPGAAIGAFIGWLSR